MNGRLYDPVNGRMLSVDNYAHDGLGSQGYNRYSYAHNNPLRYTDPDGENPMLIGALIGAGFDIAIQLISNKGDFYNINWKQVGISAIAGATGAGIGQLLSGAVKLSGITNALANAIAKGAIIGAASGAGASAVTSVMMGRRGWDLVRDIAKGALIGGAMGGAGEWLKYKWNNRKLRVTPPVTEVTVSVDDVAQEMPRPGSPDFGGYGDDIENRFHHTFDKPSHELDSFLEHYNGSKEDAFNAIQKAANEALEAGQLRPDQFGILPRGDNGYIIRVGGMDVRLIGGKVVGKTVFLSSFSRRGL